FGQTVAAGFSGWSSAKAEFDAQVKLADWVVHDLRRTVRTDIDKLGTLPHICEAVLIICRQAGPHLQSEHLCERETEGSGRVGNASKDRDCPSYRGQCNGPPQP